MRRRCTTCDHRTACLRATELLDDEAGAMVNSKRKLTPSITLKEFENGYWYATELKELADSIGVPSAGKLRKDELEKSIKLFLETGEVKKPTGRSLSSSGLKDAERG